MIWEKRNLLDASCKMTKYSLPLYFLVVQANVNYQVAAVIVTQEEKTCMLSKALKIVKGKFNTLDVIFGFSFLISLFPTNNFFLYLGFHIFPGHMFQEE